MLNNLAYMPFGYLICMNICCRSISTGIICMEAKLENSKGKPIRTYKKVKKKQKKGLDKIMLCP